MTAIAEPMVTFASDHDRDDWETFVSSHPDANFAHSFAWRKAVAVSYGHKPHYLVARAGDKVCGLLPLFLISSRLFGRVLASCPFASVGAICANDSATAHALANAAINLAEKLNVAHLELKSPRPTGVPSLISHSDFENYQVLLDDPEVLFKRFEKGTREAIRQAQRAQLRVERGPELLSAFHAVLSQSMRRLGTPVHSQCFFFNLLQLFGSNAQVLVVYLGDAAIAACFLVSFRTTVAALQAGSLPEYWRMRVNNLMYWEALRMSCVEGYQVFDFGRSIAETGTAKFKRSFGALSDSIYYEYFLRHKKEIPRFRQDNPRLQLARRVWSRLPLWVTKQAGPLLIRNIP